VAFGYVENAGWRCSPDIFVLVHRRLSPRCLQRPPESTSLVRQWMGMKSVTTLEISTFAFRFFHLQVRIAEEHPARWRPLSTAHFTASNAEWEAKETIDAGTCTRGFYLSTGGDVCSSIDIGCRIDCSHIRCTPPTLPLP